MEAASSVSTKIRSKAKPTRSMLGKVVELPVIVIGDGFLGNSAGVRKLRQQLTRELNWPGVVVSLGRWGKVSLHNAATMGCLATGWTWDRQLALRLGHRYNEAGLGSIVESSTYARILERVKEQLHGRVTSVEDRKRLPGIVASQLRLLIDSDPQVRETAIRMTEASAEVDRQLNEIHRYAGYLERLDGEEALVVIRTNEGEELRAVDADIIRALAADEPHAAFVLYELRWSRETVTSMYVPAMALEGGASEEELARRERELAAYETSLPSPRARATADEK